MNAKQLLSEYTDACELIKETEQDIRRLEAEKSTVVCDKVKGSMREFPYTEQSFAILTKHILSTVSGLIWKIKSRQA